MEGDLIKQRLKKLDKNQNWLAEEIGTSKQIVSRYAQGVYVPKKELMEKLFKALEVQYKTIDDLVN